MSLKPFTESKYQSISYSISYSNFLLLSLLQLLIFMLSTEPSFHIIQTIIIISVARQRFGQYITQAFFRYHIL